MRPIFGIVSLLIGIGFVVRVLQEQWPADKIALHLVFALAFSLVGIDLCRRSAGRKKGSE